MTGSLALAGGVLIGLCLPLAPSPAQAAGPVVVCAGAAMEGGAQLLCSHTNPDKPAQFCTFSWDLMTTDNQSRIIQGSFLIPPGTVNAQEYQGSGFSTAIGEPIVLCRGKKSGDTSGDD